MKWLYFITTLIFLTTLVLAESPDGYESISPDLSSSLESKTQRKRELFGDSFGKFSQGYDVAHIKHSYIKPFVVQYPVQSFPIGVKIPFKNPHQKRPHAHHHHGSSSKIPHFHVHNPVHLPKPAWPVNNCNHGQGSNINPRPLAPPTPPPTPLVPIPTGNIPALAVPVKPALIPPIFNAQPFVPIAAPLPLAPIPFAPALPVSPIAPVAPIAHLKPILPAPVLPSVIKHGLSTHSFSFATFPRHHYVNALPALAPAPIVPAPVLPAPAPFIHGPPHLLPAPIAPVAPLLHKVPVAHFPVPAQFPIGRIPIGQVPLNIGRIPVGFASQSHLFNQIPVNFPVAHGVSPLPAQAPLGVSHFPQEVHGVSPFPAQTPLGVSPFPQEAHGVSPLPAQTPVGVSPFPQEAPNGQHPLFAQGPSGHDFNGQIPIQHPQPVDEQGFPQQQFPSNPFQPESAGGSSVSPGFQGQGNDFANTIPNVQPGVSNVWTPMSNPNPDQFPSFQYPQQEQFPSQINPGGETSQVQPQGTGQENQGYTYQQNGNQPFQDGQNIQQSLQQQAEQQFLQAQQYFSQQGQPAQEQNLQEQQEQSFNQQQSQQYSSPQQQQEADENVQQFSQQQFISGNQLSSGDPQHDPQLPQALPDHRPVNQAYVRINHRRRLRKRPNRNQEE